MKGKTISLSVVVNFLRSPCRGLGGVALLLFSCGKGNDIPFSTNLTNCPANSTCIYAYYNNADFTAGNKPFAGSYSVFWYQNISNSTCGRTSQFYFKIPLHNNQFVFNSSQIISGQVVSNYYPCPCCYSAFLDRAISGEIKGKRISTTTWLINARIVFGVNNYPTDTITVNQYFISSPLPN